MFGYVRLCHLYLAMFGYVWVRSATCHLVRSNCFTCHVACLTISPPQIHTPFPNVELVIGVTYLNQVRGLDTGSRLFSNGGRAAFVRELRPARALAYDMALGRGNQAGTN